MSHANVGAVEDSLVVKFLKNCVSLYAVIVPFQPVHELCPVCVRWPATVVNLLLFLKGIGSGSGRLCWIPGHHALVAAGIGTVLVISGSLGIRNNSMSRPDVGSVGATIRSPIPNWHRLWGKYDAVKNSSLPSRVSLSITSSSKYVSWRCVSCST